MDNLCPTCGKISWFCRCKLENKEMTPEERAKSIVGTAATIEVLQSAWMGKQPSMSLEQQVIAAIHAAIAEEREACAKIAESFGVYQGHGENSIAAAIRARGKE